MGAIIWSEVKPYSNLNILEIFSKVTDLQDKSLAYIRE